jgi:HK97 family phage prohead protease
MNLQTKQLDYTKLDLKFAASGLAFSGYASVFDSVDAYNDTIEKGAYSETINPEKRNRPIRMRWNHYGDIIGKWLTIKEDAKGLFVEGELTPNHSKASDVYASMKHGAIDGMSIGYRVVEAETLPSGIQLLKKIDLVEISVVEEPADLGAKIGEVKSLIEECNSLKEIEALLRDAGRFSRAEATMLVSRIKSTAQSEFVAEMKAKEEIKKIFQGALSQHQ